MVKGKNLYGTKQIQIPAPKFIVFYNGIEEHLDHEVLRLSDAFALGDEDVSLELKADMLNINLGYNEELMETCKTLRDYSEYVYRVRKYAKDNSVEGAVEKAINECMREGILQDFLERHRAEAKAMSIYEYNEEEHMRMEREDAFEDGHRVGKAEGKAIGKEVGKEIERCHIIRELQKSIHLEEIVEMTQYEGNFVKCVLELIKRYPEASDEEILEKIIEE